jgi:hypothetical protein
MAFMGYLLGWAFYVSCPSSFTFSFFFFVPSPFSCLEHMVSPCLAL